MKTFAKFAAFALFGIAALLTAPAAQAQVSVNVQVGAPAWGPPVPAGVQFYYIPEIDGYYDLYNRQYIVFQDGYWVPLPQLYGYDPYQFHPVALNYCGPQPWGYRRDYYRANYAWRPYRPYRSNGPGYYRNNNQGFAYDNRRNGDGRYDNGGRNNDGYSNNGGQPGGPGRGGYNNGPGHNGREPQRGRQGGGRR